MVGNAGNAGSAGNAGNAGNADKAHRAGNAGSASNAGNVGNAGNAGNARSLPAALRLDDYGVAPGDLVRALLHCEPGRIRRKVIASPIWGAEIFRHCVERVETLVDGVLWDMQHRGEAMTLFCSGMGAPRIGDAVVAFGCTPCEKLMLTGSAGGFSPAMNIGDLLLPDTMLRGDGFSRYLSAQTGLPDRFFTAAAPAAGLLQRTASVAQAHCAQSGPALHRGAVASVDSFVMQFPHLDWMTGKHGCVGVEMEGAAVFGAAELVGIEACALFQVSDVWPLKKSFVSNTAEHERQHRRGTRDHIVTRIILDVLAAE